MKKGQMPLFMQAIYGSVLGVSSFTFIQRLPRNTDFWHTVTNKYLLFDASFFVITLLIIAHDWFSYHHNEPEPNRKFPYYIFDILALFFVAQMFATANYEQIKYWYLFGAAYTLCNVANFIKNIINKKIGSGLIRREGIMLGIHLLIVAAALYLLPNDAPSKDAPLPNLSSYWYWIGGTALAVAILWLIVGSYNDPNDRKITATIEIDTETTIKWKKPKENENEIRLQVSSSDINRHTMLNKMAQELFNKTDEIKKQNRTELLNELKEFEKYINVPKPTDFNLDTYLATKQENIRDFIKANQSKKLLDIING